MRLPGDIQLSSKYLMSLIISFQFEAKEELRWGSVCMSRGKSPETKQPQIWNVVEMQLNWSQNPTVHSFRSMTVPLEAFSP